MYSATMVAVAPYFGRTSKNGPVWVLARIGWWSTTTSGITREGSWLLPPRRVLRLPAQDLGEARARAPQAGRVLALGLGALDELVEPRQILEHLVAAGQLLVALEAADPDVQTSRSILIRGGEGGFELHAVVARHGLLFWG